MVIAINPLKKPDKMDNIFFESWESFGRTFFITIVAYFILIFLLRTSGKRTLSKMNAFDFIITIGLGSCLATVALNKNVPLVEGALVFFLLIYLQYSITWLSVRRKKIKRLVTSQPTLLLYKGEILDATMKKQRITREELNVAARKKGISNIKTIDAIIMETTGDITIIKKLSDPKNSGSTLISIEKYPPEN